MSDKRIKVEINDMNFFVVGDDNPEYVKKLAKSLDQKIKNTQHSNYKLNQVQCLVLTALNILDEKEKAEIKNKDIKNLINSNELYKQSFKRIEELTNAQKTYLSEKEKTDTKLSKYKSDILKLDAENNALKEENKEYKQKSQTFDSETKELKTELEALKREKQILENQIYDSQKRIIDLSREIDIINED